MAFDPQSTGDLQEGLNRRGARNLTHTYTYGGGSGGNTGTVGRGLDKLETQAQLIKRGDTSLVSRRGGSRLPGTGPGLWPPPARHGRPVMRRLLQATRNGNWQ